MKRSIILFFFCLLAASSSIAQTLVANATVRYQKNGVWHFESFFPESSNTIIADQGTPIDITVKRIADANLPVQFWLNDWHNGSFMDHTTSNYSYTFSNCVGPLNAQIWVGVNTNEGRIEIFVEWKNPPLPDLAVTNIRIDANVAPSYESYHVGQTVNIKSNVYNVGGATAGSSKLGYYIKTSEGNTSGSPFTWSQVPSLSKGTFSPQEINYTFTINDVGTRYFVFEADYLNEVEEATLGNNVRSFGPFQVVSPPTLSLMPLTYNFGTVNVNNCSQEQDFILTNNGGISVSGKVMLRTSRNFSFVSGGGNYSLNPGQSKTIKIKFCPEAAGELSNNLRVYVDGVSAPLVQANLSGTGHVPPQAIVGISPEFVFDTRLINAGGIYLKVIETGSENLVKKVGYEYSYKENWSQLNPTVAQNLFEINEDNAVFLTPPTFPDGASSKIDFKNQILLFDENEERIGHIKYSYSFEWEGVNIRHAIIFLHNDGPIFGEGSLFFPYSINNPNNPPGNTYNYYQTGDYPVSMLIPPHDSIKGFNEGYRIPLAGAFNKKPVLFVHGLTGTFSYQDESNPSETSVLGDQVSYWYNTERKLNTTLVGGERQYHAWQFYYPNEDDIEHCGLMLENAVNFLYGKYATPINFVAHSMGTLVTMECLTKPDFYSPAKIGRVILSMPPIHGSIAANRNYRSLDGLFMQYFGQDGKAPAYRDLSIGSRFINNLHNRTWSEQLTNNTLVLIGLTTRNYKAYMYIFETMLHNESLHHSDGVVSLSSASLLEQNIPFVAYYGNHDDGKYSKTLSDKLFLPNLIHSYFNDSSQDLISFKTFCQEDPIVEVFVEKDKTIFKPQGMTFDDLAISKPNVDFQKGLVTLRSNSIDYNKLEFLLNNLDNTFRLKTPGGNPPNQQTTINLGFFSKNPYNQNSNYLFNYFFSKSEGQNTAFGFPGLIYNECSPVLFNDLTNWPHFLGNLCKRTMEHQFVNFDLPYQKNNLVVQQTPTKTLLLNETSYTKESKLYVDDQTVSAEFYFFSEEAYFNNTYYSFSLQSPQGSILDSISAGIDYFEYPFTTVKKITIQNPEPGEWTVIPITDQNSYNAYDFITKAHLASQIKLESLISQHEHAAKIPIQLSGIIEMPDSDLLVQDSLRTFFLINQGAFLEDTIYINNIQPVETGYVFSGTFIADTIGVYNYTIIVEGIYDGYKFERAVYGDFVVSSIAPVLAVPDIELDIFQPFFELLLPNFLFCIQCDFDNLEFEVSIDGNTFINDNLFYEFDLATNTMAFSANSAGPNAEALFSVVCQVSDTIITSDSFRVRFTAAGIPSFLSASNINLHSVLLNWIPKGSEQHWDIKYGPTGFNPETEGTLMPGITERPYLLESLTQSTSYDFYVRAVFGEDQHSAWSWPASFTTNHLIIANSGNNGQLEPEGNIEIAHRSDQVFQVVPFTGYHVDDVQLDGQTIGAVESHSFIDVQQSHYIYATFAVNVYTITAQPNNEGFGAVNGAGNYEHFQEVAMIATPATGYHFVNWTENGIEVSSNTSYSFTAEGPRNLTANFAINVYTITAQPNNEGFGAVNGAGNYEHFQEVTLVASPSTNYYFVNWTENGIEVSPNTSFSFIAEANRELIANFDYATSIPGISPEGAQIYPNPFSNQITIKNAGNIERIQITNLLGQVMLEKVLNGSEIEIVSTAGLPRGIYFVTLIKKSGNQEVVKMVKE